MKQSGSYILAALAALASFAPPPSNADVEKPVRQLVFAMTVSASTDADTLSFGGTGWNLGGPSVARVAAGQATGTIKVDILRVMPDHTVVANVTEQTRVHARPAVRVIIDPQGTVFFGRADIANFSGEQRLLLHLLTPGLVTPQQVALGGWTSDAPLASGHQKQTFKVAGTLPNGDAKLQLIESISITGAQKYDTETHANILYDTVKGVPKNIDLEMREQHESARGPEVSALSANYELTSDSAGS